MQRRVSWLGLGAVSVLGLVGMASCGSDDEGCEATRTCGASGSGGAAGSSGADGGGTGGTSGSAGDAGVPCSNNSTCDNGLACDGQEACVEGTCMPGTPPCANPDPDHCEATCVEAVTGPDCGVAALDADNDQHKDALCAADPGDDCDDSDNTVYPGATETCDGVDSNCNGKLDIDDGFTLSGTTGNFVATYAHAFTPRITWSSTAKQYGVVWVDERDLSTGDEEIYFARMDETGAKVGSDTRISNAKGISFGPSVAAGNSSFGIAWADNRQGNAIYFRRMSDSGAPMGGEVVVAPGTGDNAGPTIVAMSQGWAVFWQRNFTGGSSRIVGRLLAADGSASGPERIYGAPNEVNFVPIAATAGADVAVAYSHSPSGQPNSVQLLRTNASLTETGLELVHKPSSGFSWFPVVAATGTGWSAMWRNNQTGDGSLGFSVRNLDGTASCGPVASQTFDATAYPQGLVQTPGGAIGVVSEAQNTTTGKIRLARFAPDCSELPDFTLDEQLKLQLWFIGDIAQGDNSIAVVWEENAEPSFRIRRRVFGKNLCD